MKRSWGWSLNEGNYPNIAIYTKPRGFRVAFRIHNWGFAFGYVDSFFTEKHKVRLPIVRF